MMQPFEGLWKKTVSVFNEDKLVLIAKYVKPAIEHRGIGYIVPEEIRRLVGTVED
jgi:hypothetical protein